MISIGARRLFLCGQPVDMRKGMDGLASIVLAQLQQDPSSGDIFLDLRYFEWETNPYHF
jgi:hypothetical protein